MVQAARNSISHAVLAPLLGDGGSSSMNQLATRGDNAPLNVASAFIAIEIVPYGGGGRMTENLSKVDS